MESVPSLWAELPLSTGIATLVCYAGVFGDAIGVEEMALRLGVTASDKYYATLDMMHRDGRLVLRNGYAALPGLEEKLALKTAKLETSARLIAKRMEDLKKMTANPLIEFVGISGSLAAGNPTRDRNHHLDLDVFVITRSQCLWFYMIPLIVRGQFPRKEIEPELCINMVMDASNLEIPHKNFYTATEIRNLIPVVVTDAYRKFLRTNRWVDYYYPGFSGSLPSNSPSIPTGDLINKSMYVFFNLLRCAKRCSLDPLRKASFKSDLLNGVTYNKVGTNYGGYQGLVSSKFTRLASEWFPDCLNAAHIERLFPDKLSAGIRQGHIDVFKINAAEGLAYDYGKYV